MNFKFKVTERKAFTLSETLITLVIIGIVATMVLPVTINNIQDKHFEAMAKKAQHTIANGYKLMMSHQDITDVKLIDFLGSCNGLTNINCLSSAHKGYFKILSDSAGTLKSKNMPAEYSILNTNDKSPFKWSDTKYILLTSDGVTFGLLPGEDNVSIDIVADLNSDKKPNTVSRDLRKYRFSGHGELFDVTEELAQTSTCRWGNLAACTTKEACMAVKPPKDSSTEMVWVDEEYQNRVYGTDQYNPDLKDPEKYNLGANRCSYLSPG